MDPTPEQQAALDLFATGKPLVIEAGAGTGKTSTLELIARSTTRSGIYTAFGRKVKEDAALRFPMTCRASTMHSLAYQATKYRLQLRRRLDTAARAPGWKIAKALGIGPVYLQVPDPTPRTKVLQPGTLAGHVMRALVRFCESDDPEPGPEHFAFLEGIDGHRPDGSRRTANNRELAREMTEPLRQAWAEIQDPHSDLPANFTQITAAYLKVWQLTNPELPADYVLFDEAQDANPVMLAVFAANAGKQLVYVGDSCQQIYEWRGAVNALDLLAGERTYLTQSFRFGPRIATLANEILGVLEAPLKLKGLDSLVSEVRSVAQPRAILCRANATAINVLLAQQRQGRAVHLVGDANEVLNFARECAKLEGGDRSYHRDLACFETWAEVLAYVEQDPLGSDLRMLVDLYRDYGLQIITDALEGHVAEQAADVIVSTAHQAKGREWDTVRIARDFDPPTDRDGTPAWDLSVAEWRLLYVACTRAKQTLDVTRCQAVTDLIGAQAA